MATLIQTVAGAVPSDQLGRVLTHEHIVSLYGGWGGGGWWPKMSDQPQAGWREAALRHYTPLLTALRQEHGVGTIVEVTPGWQSRGPADLDLWSELSRRSGVNIVVTSGDFQGSDLGLPGRQRGSETAAQLAAQMVRETTQGICSTKVRAGMIKVHADPGTPYGRNLIHAAAIAQRETGLSLTTCAAHHRFYLDTWEMLGVPAERICLSHADSAHLLPEIIPLLRRGCKFNMTLWGLRNPEETGWRWPDVPEFYSPAYVAALVAEGYTRQMFPSVDYSAMKGFAEGGEVREDLYHVEGRTYLYLFTHAIPALRRFGVSEADIETMLRDNPRRLLEPTR